jgi:hypothetical protein
MPQRTELFFNAPVHDWHQGTDMRAAWQLLLRLLELLELCSQNAQVDREVL